MLRRSFFSLIGGLTASLPFMKEKEDVITKIKLGDEIYYAKNETVFKREKIIDGKIYSTSFYNEKGELHREDGPAIEYANGDKYWYKNGQFHREDGPAIEYADGNKFWYKNGIRMVNTIEMMDPPLSL